MEKVPIGLSEDEMEISPERAFQQHKYDILNDERARDILISDGRELIAEILDEKPDDLVFLDKAARPVADLIRKMWPHEAGDTPMPKIHFVNIGSEKWDYFKEPIEQNPEKYEPLKEAFSLKTNGETAKHSIFEGRKVLIIDDIMFSGKSLSGAAFAFRETFGDEASLIDADYFHRKGDEGVDPLYWGMPWAFSNMKKKEGLTGVVDKEGSDEILTTPTRLPDQRQKALGLRAEISALTDEYYRSPSTKNLDKKPEVPDICPETGISEKFVEFFYLTRKAATYIEFYKMPEDTVKQGISEDIRREPLVHYATYFRRLNLSVTVTDFNKARIEELNQLVDYVNSNWKNPDSFTLDDVKTVGARVQELITGN